MGDRDNVFIYWGDSKIGDVITLKGKRVVIKELTSLPRIVPACEVCCFQHGGDCPKFGASGVSDGFLVCQNYHSSGRLIYFDWAEGVA